MSTRQSKLSTFVVAAALLLGIGLFAGCSNPKAQVAEVVKGYVAAEKAGAQTVQKPYVVDADKKVLEQKEKERKMPDKLKGLLKAAQKGLDAFVEVEVKSMKTEGGTGTVEAKISAPAKKSVDKLLDKTVNAAAKKHEGKGESEMIQALADSVEKALKEADLETTSTTRSFDIQKEDGTWLIFANLAAQQEIVDLVESGKKAAQTKKLDPARAKLKAARKALKGKRFPRAEEKARGLEALILSQQARAHIEAGEFSEAIPTLKKVEKLDAFGGIRSFSPKQAAEKRAELEEILSYSEKLKIETKVTKKFGLGIDGTLENTGDRKIKTLELAFNFKDEKGETIQQATSRAVTAFGDSDEVLKPGESIDIGAFADKKKVGEDWSEDYEVKVAKLQFLDNS